MNQFNLENQYQSYLQRVGLSEQSMDAVQQIETKRAFMGTCGQILVLLSEGMDGVSENAGLILLASLFDQVEAFWKKEDSRSSTQEIIIIDDQGTINCETLFEKIKDLPKG
ncbi:hypothetical protein [Dyadobacter diqingensis]|uniref:hypothetical protein n=1 Tax=Dyadobacter diqingensis TaxID=2938121 RepID=UPI0020C50745|nr:hypothetical protein [Dyadobacter diqingensis]